LKDRQRPTRGFTLLEVMIAMAILAMALVALLGHEGVAIQMSDYSNRVSQATMLAQGKFLDVEHKLIKDGMDTMDDCDDGDFRDEGFRRFKWKACAYPLEMEDGVADQLNEQIMGMMAGMGMGDMETLMNAAASGGKGADAQQGAMAAQVQQAIGAIPMFLEQLKDKVRKVRLEVTWTDPMGDRQVVLERFVTELGTDPANKPPPKDGDSDLDMVEELKKEALEAAIP
jgi:general secretion pathway protein I